MINTRFCCQKTTIFIVSIMPLNSRFHSNLMLVVKEGCFSQVLLINFLILMNQICCNLSLVLVLELDGGDLKIHPSTCTLLGLFDLFTVEVILLSYLFTCIDTKASGLSHKFLSSIILLFTNVCIRLVIIMTKILLGCQQVQLRPKTSTED